MAWFIRGIFLLLLLFAIAIGAGAFMEPRLYVERSAFIDHEDFVIFPYMNDLSKAHSWSPFFLTDTDADVVFTGPPEGVGQAVAWRGSKSGTGSQTILDSQQDQMVRSSVTIGGREGEMLIAIQQAEQGGTHILLSYETELGGFPFMDRLMKPITEKEMEANFDQAMDVLDELIDVELNVTHDAPE